MCFVSFLYTRGVWGRGARNLCRENFPFSDRVAKQTERQWTQKETVCVCLPVKCFFCLIYRLSRQWIAFDGRLPLALELGGRQTGGKRLRAAQKQKISAGKVVEWVRDSEEASNWAGNFRKSRKLPQRSRNGQKRLRRQFWGVRKNFLGRKKMRQSCWKVGKPILALLVYSGPKAQLLHFDGPNFSFKRWICRSGIQFRPSFGLKT